MDWLNLHTSILDSPEFIRSTPVQRSAWLCLLRYCAGQENGGTIINCKSWGDGTWQQLCRIKLREIKMDSELWSFSGSDLIVNFYPVEKEQEVMKNRQNGKRGGRPKNNQVVNRVVNPEGTKWFDFAETEGKGIGKEKEEEGETRARALKIKFIEDLGAKTKKGEEDLLPEWEAVMKGLKNQRIEEIFKNAKPGIIWPSQFTQWRKAHGNY